MSKIPCEIVRDLLPSYVDQLTNETTNQYMEEHLAECSPCRELYETMKAPEVLQPSADDGSKTGSADNGSGEKKEIDFLKKTRRREKAVIWGFIAALVILLGVVFVTRYMIGSYVRDPHSDFFMWECEVDGNQLSLNGRVVDDIYKICSWETNDDFGIVEIDTKVVPSGFIASLIYGKEFHYDYTCYRPIRQVIVNGRILYNDGSAVSTQASSIYQTRHLYIGDMPANNLTANALNISNYLGRYENELQTSVEPFGWTFHLLKDIPAKRQAILEEDMESFAYVLIAVIDNLGEVTYDYTVDGKSFTKTVTSSDATTFFGQDIKNCYEDVSLLDNLLQQTGLRYYAFGSVFSEASDETTSAEDLTTTEGSTAYDLPIPIVNIVNNTDEQIKSIMATIYIDGEALWSEGVQNADGTSLERGQLYSFTDPGTEEDLSYRLNDNSKVEIELGVYTMDDKYYEVSGRLRIPLKSGILYDIHITGNAEEGFTAGQ